MEYREVDGLAIAYGLAHQRIGIEFTIAADEGGEATRLEIAGQSADKVDGRCGGSGAFFIAERLTGLLE
jgi:hypothetical protein